MALSDTPAAFHPDRRATYEFGEERDWVRSRSQMRYLEYRHGVYFPWKVFYELVPSLRCEGQASRSARNARADWSAVRLQRRLVPARLRSFAAYGAILT